MRLLEPEGSWVGDEEIADDEVVIAATREELAGCIGGLGEALEAVEDWEFHLRLGITRQEARALIWRIHEVLQGAYQPE